MWLRTCRPSRLRALPVCRPGLPLNGVNTSTAARYAIPQGRLPVQWTRGAKRTSKAVLAAAPQGALPRVAAAYVDDAAVQAQAYPTVVQQAYNNMQKFENCVLLTRVGGFYELYLDQAETYAPLLNMKLAMKSISNGRKVPMAGFPYFQLDRYLKMLVQDLHKYVAVAEEFPNDAAAKVKSGGLLFDRKVTRVITPGTLIDEKFMDPWESNFVLAIDHQTYDVSPAEAKNEAEQEARTSPIGLAWLDLSSGDFFTQQTTLDALASALARVSPREIIVDGASAAQIAPAVNSILKEGCYIISAHHRLVNDDSLWSAVLASHPSAPPGSAFTAQEITAGSVLLDYVHERLQGNIPHLRPPMRRSHEDYMTIDKNSLKALEIRQTMRDGGTEGSLLQTVRRTVTKSGHRLLSQRLLSPSTSITEINERLDLVTSFMGNVVLKESIVASLSMTFDTWRLLQKFSFGRGDADDLLSLARTIQLTDDIRHTLQSEQLLTSDSDDTKSTALARVSQRLDMAEALILADEIVASIDEDKLSEQHRIEDDEVAAAVELAENVLTQGGEKLSGVPASVKKARARSDHDREKDTGLPIDVWIMRPSASKVLTKLHNDFDRLLLEKSDLESELRQQSGAQSLNLKWTPGLGHIVHLKGKDSAASLASLDLGSVRAVSSSRSTRSFHHPHWTKLGTRIDDARLRIRAEEARVFASLRTKVITNLVRLRRNAAVLDELDVAASFATLAAEKQWTRPKLDYGFAHHIIGGRHPTVEANLLAQGRSFVPNDCIIGTTTAATTTPHIMLITGPNMAGKSTFLRQNALVSILAQTGSYVPAAYAAIGIVDAILSRVGSADSLHADQSTFMVEMLETAHILRVATHRSFVVMDEVGRGTTPEDGLAVSFAALEHLAATNRCRALFATHFHALADLTRAWPSVRCMCTDVVEDEAGGAGARERGWSFVHRLREGVNRKSHALKVARLAGMPESVLQSAQSVLDQLQLSHGQSAGQAQSHSATATSDKADDDRHL